MGSNPQVTTARRLIPGHPRPVWGSPKPKLLINGHGQHGKDTVGELLAERHGYTITNASMIFAKYLMDTVLPTGWYSSVQECYDDRSNHRDGWYEAVRKHNYNDEMALVKKALAQGEIYCGLRRSTEFKVSPELFDYSIWVSADIRGVPREPEGSMGITEAGHDYTIYNNGSTTELVAEVDILAEWLANPQTPPIIGEPHVQS